MPPRTRKSKRKVKVESSSEEEEEYETLDAHVSSKKRKQDETKSNKLVIKKEEDRLSEYQDESDHFVQQMVKSIKELQNNETLSKIFSNDCAMKLKERSIGIVNLLKVIVDEFLINVSQAEMFMKSCSIRSIGQDNCCLSNIGLPEIMAIVLSFLPIKSFLWARRVCKLWLQASERPEALVHYDYWFKSTVSEMQYFNKYYAFRTNEIVKYRKGLERIRKYFPKATPIANIEIPRLDRQLNQDDVHAECFSLEKTSTIFNNLETLACGLSAFIFSAFSKAPNATNHFPNLKKLKIEGFTKKLKEIVISHPKLTEISIRGCSFINISCPMLEICEIHSKVEMLSISTGQSTHPQRAMYDVGCKFPYQCVFLD